MHLGGEQLRELRYASLLHDFGKVGVREEVLVKAKKLYPADLQRIEWRFRLARAGLQADLLSRRLRYLEEAGRDGYDDFLGQLREEGADRAADLDRMEETIRQSNEPTILEEGNFEHLQEMGARMLTLPDTEPLPALAEPELLKLSLRKGTLDDAERKEIESHVTHTYSFLIQIPWTADLRRVPEIAYGHHEKLNGKGYPRALPGEEIPVQTRMMTISDIFDALTARDRPYKRAMPTERALTILEYEAKDELLDRDLLDVFLEAKVFDLVDRGA